MFHFLAALVALSAACGYINYRWLRWPPAIGIMALSLLLSLAVFMLGNRWPFAEEAARALLEHLSFDEFFMQGMLSFLLFAGALHVSLEDLLRHKWEVGLLATLGVVISTLLVGVFSWWVLEALGIGISLAYCMLFGALISPTDPIAVLAILKRAGAPKNLEIVIAGESLFNDGMGVALFLILLPFATGSQSLAGDSVLWLILEEGGGGIALGLLFGWLAYRVLRTVDDYGVEVMITVAVAMGAYSFATILETSGPIAVVVAGLVIGHHGRQFAMSDTSREYLDHFWGVVDEALNGILFVLIGLEVLVVVNSGAHLAAAVGVIPAVLAARLVSVGFPIGLMRRFRRFPQRTVLVLTWGGLRGGISVALALSLPEGLEREVILSITYGVVVFSILVQGLTVSRLVPNGV